MKGSNNCDVHSVGRHLLSHGKTTDRSHDDDDDDDEEEEEQDDDDDDDVVTSSLSADVWPILIHHIMTMSPPEMHLLTACPPLPPNPLFTHTTHHSSI